MYEAHFSIPMSGGRIINTINTKLNYNEIEHILKNSKSKFLIVHSDYLDEIVKIQKVKLKKIFLVIVNYKNIKKKYNIKYETYEKFLKKRLYKGEYL